MSKPVILTGIRANNDLTIGNYFGAILPIIDMAKTRSDEFQVNLFIPDLHSFTTPIDHSQLYQQIMHTARLFAAAGLPLDNQDIHLYRQSYIPAHSELTWILDCFTGVGEIARMTQFKEKSHSASLELIESLKKSSSSKSKNGDEDKINRSVKSLIEKYKDQPDVSADIYELGIAAYETSMNESKAHITTLDMAIKFAQEAVASGNSSLGLLNYPVLMAADILLYNAQYVPVGEDQTQHLEFTRDIAERINSRFGNTLTVPESVKAQHEFFGKDQGLRIKDLVDPTKKMSKSDDSGRGVIFLGDEPATAAKKIMSATTDDKAEIHYDRDNQPGISNLLDILALLKGATLQEVVARFEGQTSYGDFKKVVADEVERFLTEFQQKLATVDDSAVISKLEQSERDLTPVANETLLRVQRAVGLRPKDS